jgi:hypothetical protein
MSSSSNKPKGAWCRISLRVMMVIVLIFAIALGWQVNTAESDQAIRRTSDQDNRWFVVEAAGGLNCRVAA